MADASTNRLKTKVAPAEVPGVEGLTTVVVAVTVVGALYLAREVLVPITLAILLSFVLAPLVMLLRKPGLPRVPAVVSAVVLALGIILALGMVIGSQVAQLASDLPRYASTIEQKVDAVRTYTTGRMAQLTQQLGRDAAPASPPASSSATLPTPARAPTTPRGQAPAAAPANPQAPSPAPIQVEVHQPDPSPLTMAQRIVEPILSPLATTGIVFIVAIFILMQKEDLRDRLIRLFGSGDLHRTTAALDEAAARLSRYFLTQLALNASFGVVVTLGLLLIGVPNPMLWGIVAGLLRFVPYVGALASAAFPVALAAAVDPGWTLALETAAFFLVLEGLTGQVIEPLLYGHSTGLSPVSVVISAIFWTWLWGPVGLILSMPLSLCLVVLGRHVERMQFIDVLLGDQPALTPAESFYQRILAGDTDEALDQAEILLRERSLSSYYDEVALRGLHLAANDSLRGVLTDPQLLNIQDAISGVVVDLADHKDVEPEKTKQESVPAGRTTPDPQHLAVAPVLDAALGELPADWAGVAPVLCVAGRGPLDEAACTMLAQLLVKHGLRARVVSYEAVSRTGISSLDVTDVAMVCVSYLEASGSPSMLRYLMRRLRTRVPSAPMLVGLWQADQAALDDERLRAAIGADHYVTSLRDAVAACVAAAEAARQTPTSLAPAAQPLQEVAPA